MINQKKTNLLEFEIEKISNETSDNKNSIFYKLLSENIIISREIDTITLEKKIFFTYEAFFEYVISRYLLKSWKDLNKKQILENTLKIIEEINTFRNYKGTIEYIILILESLGNEIYKDILEQVTEYDSFLGVNIIGKLKNIMKVKNILFKLASFSNIELHRQILDILEKNEEKLEDSFIYSMRSNLIFSFSKPRKLLML